MEQLHVDPQLNDSYGYECAAVNVFLLTTDKTIAFCAYERTVVVMILSS